MTARRLTAAMRPAFCTDWLTPHLPLWEKHFSPLRGKPDLRFLEVGPERPPRTRSPVRPERRRAHPPSFTQYAPYASFGSVRMGDVMSRSRRNSSTALRQPAQTP